jgi:hypothetical protein
MTLATYSDLLAAIADTLNRDDLTAVIPSFVAMAEARVNRDVRHWRMEKRVTAQLDLQYSTLPGDFVRPIRLQLVAGGEVKPISTAQMLQLRADRDDRGGRPEHYALTAGSLELFPTPDKAYDASLVYYGRVPALTTLAPTNWLLTEAPDVYLYASLVHSAPYLKDDARLPVWEGLAAQAIDRLNISGSDAKYGGTGLVMRTRRGAA